MHVLYICRSKYSQASKKMQACLRFFYIYNIIWKHNIVVWSCHCPNVAVCLCMHVIFWEVYCASGWCGLSCILYCAISLAIPIIPFIFYKTKHLGLLQTNAAIGNAISCQHRILFSIKLFAHYKLLKAYHGQWWSIFLIHLLQILQWWALGGL